MANAQHQSPLMCTLLLGYQLTARQFLRIWPAEPVSGLMFVGKLGDFTTNLIQKMTELVAC